MAGSAAAAAKQCIVLSFGAWGELASCTSSKLTSCLSVQANSPVFTILDHIYSRLSLCIVRSNARVFLVPPSPSVNLVLFSLLTYFIPYFLMFV